MNKLILIFLLFFLFNNPIFGQTKIPFIIQEGSNFGSVILDNKVVVVNTKKLKKIKRKSKRFMKQHRTDFDVNDYKKNKRFNSRFKSYSKTDLNTLPYRLQNEIIFVDETLNEIGYHAGKLIISEQKSHHGDYISFVVVYNYQTNKIARIIVKNTGYFLE